MPIIKKIQNVINFYNVHSGVPGTPLGFQFSSFLCVTGLAPQTLHVGASIPFPNPATALPLANLDSPLVHKLGHVSPAKHVTAENTFSYHEIFTSSKDS